jgi:hypothetical protein
MGSRAISVTDQVLNWTPVGADQHVAVSNAVQTIATANPATRFVQLNVQGADVRVRLDGNDPVGGSAGALWKNGTFAYWKKDLLATAKFIRDGGTDAVVHVQEFSI